MLKQTVIETNDDNTGVELKNKYRNKEPIPLIGNIISYEVNVTPIQNNWKFIVEPNE